MRVTAWSKITTRNIKDNSPVSIKNGCFEFTFTFEYSSTYCWICEIRSHGVGVIKEEDTNLTRLKRVAKSWQRQV